MNNHDFQSLRQKMVDCQIRTTDVTDLALLDAFLDVPREAFVPKSKRDFAYIDEDICLAPSENGSMARYLMEPSPLARLLQLAQLKTDDVVLDAGCATGYASAVMSKIVGSVIALDSDSDLIDLASEALTDLGCDNVVTVQGPIEQGLASEAPYDVIFVNGAVDEIPSVLFSQMRDGGRLVAVVGTGNTGKAMLYVKQGKNVAGRHAFDAAIRPLPGFQKEPAFNF